MTAAEQRQAAKQFAQEWAGRGAEKSESQVFWLSLLHKVYGITEPEKMLIFEENLKIDRNSFIDVRIPETKVLIEQKSLTKDLRKGIRQSDGTLLTPFQQAKRYAIDLPYSERPRWIITCNFRSFLIYDMEKPSGEPEEILLENLEKEYYRLQFLVETGNDHLKREMEVSIQAGEIVGLLYDEILKQYLDPESEVSLKSLNMLCVRLVFCLYAEDAGIFGQKGMFHDYLADFKTENLREALLNLFQILDTPEEARDPYLPPRLTAFPYVNGGLFSGEIIEIPRFNERIRELLLDKASDDFDWSEISPTIFGALFESTLNPETRRSGGMHYTSIENIHKVIDPLFLNDLKTELSQIQANSILKKRNEQLKELQKKLAGLHFLDPACGSGNFLTETYLSLRRVENQILELLYADFGIKMGLGEFSPIQVSIGQFYGIELNDFAVTVAKTALWIAESQMLKETEDVIHLNLEFLPLRSYANIVEGNALRLDWETVIPKYNLHYIMGNPPFVGYSLQDKSQKSDILSVYIDEKGKPYKATGKIDYVSGWYFKASQFMVGTKIRSAFVSTNSITQGEQVALIWKPLYDRFGIHIDFAYSTFKWNSEAKGKAAVHCVIIGFSVASAKQEKELYISDRMKIVDNINAYLLNAPNIFITSRTKPICEVIEMTTGNRPADGGHLIIEENEYENFIKREPKAIPYLKRFTGAIEFINNKKRWCLWLVGVSPTEIKQMPEVYKRVELCKADRLKGADDRKKLAFTPALFREIKNPDTSMIIPLHSSENRRYIPIGFITSDVIANNATSIIPDATLYHFGILTSNVHMAWVRVIAGRLKSDYRYSGKVVYNNFPWPSPTEEQKQKIESTAQAILAARDLYPDNSLADLYDEITMPPQLRKAHQENDRAVMKAYGFSVKGTTESDCVAELMKLYQQKAAELKKN